MKPEDYRALESFIRETNRRFNVIGKSLEDFYSLAKSNRDKIQQVLEEIDAIYNIQGEQGMRIKETMTEIINTQHNLEEFRMDFQVFEETAKAMYDIEQTLELDGTLKNAVEETSPDNLTVVENNDDNPLPLEEPEPQGVQPIPIAMGMTKIKYTRDDLMNMDWDRLRALAFRKYKCDITKRDRAFYVDYIMEEQMKKVETGD